MPPRPVRDAILAATLVAGILGSAGYATWIAAAEIWRWIAG